MLKTYWTFYENILKFKNLIMSKKGLVTLTAAYLAWVAAATFYWRNGKQLKKDLEKAEEEGNSKLWVVLCAFIETHKNMINSLKEEIMSEKNITNAKMKLWKYLILIKKNEKNWWLN